jgi:pre-rRNA-processing protein TSR1
MTMDACKVADYIVFVLSTTVEVNDWGETLLRTLQAQGLPEVVTVVAPNITLDSKSRSATHKSLLSFIQFFVPTQTRVYDLHIASDRLNAIRTLSEGKPGDVRWREDRSWILGESTEWSDGTLKVTGVVRGVPLSVNRLVHIPNFGDYQISQVNSFFLDYCRLLWDIPRFTLLQTLAWGGPATHHLWRWNPFF